MLAVAMPIVAAKKIGNPSRGENAGQASGLVWQPYDAAKLAEARAQGKNVFVDFTAAWCLSCQVNERVVLDRADVQDAFKKSGVILMRADWTNHDDAISEALAELGRSSVPTYVFYDGENAPRLLPEVLTTGIVMEALQKVPQAGK
jgi:thiol:disulfide interchange protein DsbD